MLDFKYSMCVEITNLLLVNYHQHEAGGLWLFRQQA